MRGEGAEPIEGYEGGVCLPLTRLNSLICPPRTQVTPGTESKLSCSRFQTEINHISKDSRTHSCVSLIQSTHKRSLVCTFTRFICSKSAVTVYNTHRISPAQDAHLPDAKLRKTSTLINNANQSNLPELTKQPCDLWGS